jgi:hypothetical protein
VFHPTLEQCGYPVLTGIVDVYFGGERPKRCIGDTGGTGVASNHVKFKILGPGRKPNDEICAAVRRVADACCAKADRGPRRACDLLASEIQWQLITAGWNGDGNGLGIME